MQVCLREVAALDEKYTQEVADVNAENDRLRAKLAAGGRVRVTDECKPQSTAPGSVGNVVTVELTPVAGSNVLSIRAGIISDQAKVRYLQEYINE
ncbi:lysis system i-spanin subunit Rz [Pantoea eucrina]|uniref:lysis system i-spanin subunit Rz n=1 Tax=Pantoea eucrina TaxID=472693 RepID=UPI003A10392E